MGETTLEKIDIIRQRFGISYEEAKKALEDNNNDLVDTLILMERNKKGFGEVFSEKGNDLLDTVKDIIQKGNVSRIKIKKDNRVLVDIPVMVGIAAGALSIMYMPILAIGAITAIVADIKIEVERPNGDIEIITDIIKKGSTGFKGKFGEFAKTAKMNFESTKDKTQGFIKVAKRKSKMVVDDVEDKMIEIKIKRDESNN